MESAGGGELTPVHALHCTKGGCCATRGGNHEARGSPKLVIMGVVLVPQPLLDNTAQLVAGKRQHAAVGVMNYVDLCQE